MSDKLIISVFNPVYCITALFFIALLVISSILLRSASEKTRRIVLTVTMAAVFILYNVYKFLLSKDTAYAEILYLAGKGSGEFTWWGELPFHLCNINLILIPIAVMTRSRPLSAFCFFLAPLGALMAILMPGIGFDGYSLLLPRMWGYYITHYMILIGGLALCTFGLFKPEFSDIIPGMLMTYAVALFAFAVSALLRVSGVFPYANYFFTFDPEGNPILELFRSWIPLPYLYLLCCSLILLPYMLLVTGGIKLVGKKLAKKKADLLI